MWAEIPMFRSFEKSVYTSYLHLQADRPTWPNRCAALRPGRSAGLETACVEPVAPRLHFSRRAMENAPFAHLGGVARAHPRINGWSHATRRGASRIGRPKRRSPGHLAETGAPGEPGRARPGRSRRLD